MKKKAYRTHGRHWIWSRQMPCGKSIDFTGRMQRRNFVRNFCMRNFDTISRCLVTVHRNLFLLGNIVRCTTARLHRWLDFAFVEPKRLRHILNEMKRNKKRKKNNEIKPKGSFCVNSSSLDTCSSVDPERLSFFPLLNNLWAFALSSFGCGVFCLTNGVWRRTTL